MITVTLSDTQFIDTFGQSQYVRGFSPDAIRAVLEIIEEDQEFSDEIIDWTAYFMEASEYTESEMIKEFYDLVDEEDSEQCEEAYEFVDLILELIDRRYVKLDNDNVLLFDV